MSPPLWAYQIENFEIPPDEELICSICRSIFCDPVQSPCNHVFCRACIIKWLENSRNCPICRKRMAAYSVQDVVPLIKNMIMKLTLKCHNSDKGCSAKFPLESCETHVKICTFEVVPCKNKPCKETFLRKDLEDHERYHCLHRCIKCTNCGQKISLKRKNHSCVDSLKLALKAKDKIIQEKQEKIKKLKKTVERLKECCDSSVSSFGSVSVSDIEIELESSFPSMSPFSVRFEDSLDNGWVSISSPDLMPLNELEDSIEYPRSSAPAVEVSVEPNPGQLLDSDALFDHAPIRRPAKRRLPAVFTSSSDEEEGLEDFSLPSPKRTSNTTDGRNGSSSSQDAGPSSRDREEMLNSSNRFAEDFGRRRTVSQEQSASRCLGLSSSARASSPFPAGAPYAFSETLDLLERYNLESDPEWLPTQHEDLDSEDDSYNMPSFDCPITSSDESSLSDSTSGSDFSESCSEIRFSSSRNRRSQSDDTTSCSSASSDEDEFRD